MYSWGSPPTNLDYTLSFSTNSLFPMESRVTWDGTTGHMPCICIPTAWPSSALQKTERERKVAQISFNGMAISNTGDYFLTELFIGSRITCNAG